MKRTAVMGFGNPVRSDDGVGCYVIEKLKEILPEDDLISLFDMGTGAFEVLFRLAGHERIIIVDAVVNSGDRPGSVFRLPASEIKAAIQDDPLVFLHGITWDQALSYARKILRDTYPDDISVYLVAVNDTRLEQGLSDPVREGGDRVIYHILNELQVNPVSFS